MDSQCIVNCKFFQCGTDVNYLRKHKTHFPYLPRNKLEKKLKCINRVQIV